MYNYLDGINENKNQLFIEAKFKMKAKPYGKSPPIFSAIKVPIIFRINDDIDISNKHEDKIIAFDDAD